jgi:phage portal protein BeeE
MALFDWLKPKPTVETASVKAKAPSSPTGDLALVDGRENGIFKSYIPGFLYKPPYGYPRAENLELIKQMARNPYIYAIIKSITDAIACTEWEIVPKKGKKLTPELEAKQEQITDFFLNPNGNKESFSDILRAVTRDILTLDSGVIVKVFNSQRELVQMFARDGGSFLKNPDIFGYIGDRADVIEPTGSLEGLDREAQINHYDLNYKDQAAYFQYGWTSQSMPIPYGRNEVIYIMQNPKADSIYGQSPVAILSDLILTLVYGSQYNLDFYMNNNMPEGIMSIQGASPDELKAFKERFEGQFRKQDEITGFWRKIGFKFPFTNRPAEFIPFQLDPKTMQVIEQQTWFTKVTWSCFGVTPDEMGFTDDSNRATSESQTEVGKRKAIKPLMNLIEYHINQEIIPEFGTVDLKFQFDNYDINEEMQKYDLYAKQQQLGVMTPEMIADEEGIDTAQILEKQEEDRELKMMRIGRPDETNAEKKSNDLDSDFMVGDKVKVISGSEDRLDQIGTIEEFTGEETVVVRFEVGKDFFNIYQLVLIETDKDNSIEGLKAKDPFNSTDVEADLMKDIYKSGKKVRAALQKYKGGKLERI